MPRIRSVKPQWLEDPKLLRAGEDARILSIGLLLLADDTGRAPADIDILRARVWPMAGLSEGSVRAHGGLTELARIGYVEVYEVRGERFLRIRNWQKHQRINRPSAPIYPGPEDGVIIDLLKESTQQFSEGSLNTHGGFSEGSLTDKEKEKEKEKDLTTIRALVAATDFYTTEDSGVKTIQDLGLIREVFDHWVTSHGRRAGTKLDCKRRAKIQARLREGYSVEQLKQAIDGCLLSEFHRQEPRWSDIATILRDATTTDGHIDRLGIKRDAQGNARPRYEVPEDVHVFAAQKLSPDPHRRVLRQPDPHADNWVIYDLITKETTSSDWTTEKILQAYEAERKAWEAESGWLTAP